MSLDALSIADLARRCADETLRFVRGEPRDDSYCFEIFARAIVRREDQAWTAIMAQYRGIILAYVGQHSAAAVLHEPEEFWVNRAFARFWSAVGPDRFGQFPDLPALLKYLKLCVHSVLMDELRARRAQSVSLDEVPENTPSIGNSEQALIGTMSGQELWSAILAELQDDAERVIAVLSFTRGLKPGEIYDRHPALYGDVADVYRIKRNVVERLRRSPHIRAFLAA
jgi:hypothetical protein